MFSLHLQFLYWQQIFFACLQVFFEFGLQTLEPYLPSFSQQLSKASSLQGLRSPGDAEEHIQDLAALQSQTGNFGLVGKGQLGVPVGIVQFFWPCLSSAALQESLVSSQ